MLLWVCHEKPQWREDLLARNQLASVAVALGGIHLFDSRGQMQFRRHDPSQETLPVAEGKPQYF